MRTSRSLRLRRAPRRSRASRHRGKVTLALLALAGVAVRVYVPLLGFSGGVGPVLELAGLALTGVCCLAVLVGWLFSLLPERLSDADREAVQWFRDLLSEGTWRDEPLAAGWQPAGPPRSASTSSDSGDPNPDKSASSVVVAKLPGEIDTFQAALPAAAAELLAAHRRLGKDEDEVRADERLRVLVALRAMRRRVTDDLGAAPALRELALRMEAVVARLDSPWTAGRPVPPLPIEPLAPQATIQQSLSPDAPVAPDCAPLDAAGPVDTAVPVDTEVPPVPSVPRDMAAPVETAAPVAVAVPVATAVAVAAAVPADTSVSSAPVADLDELSSRSLFARGEVISPPISPHPGISALGTPNRRGGWFRRRAARTRAA